jgi:fumarate reductase subunit C
MQELYGTTQTTSAFLAFELLTILHAFELSSVWVNYSKNYEFLTKQLVMLPNAIIFSISVITSAAHNHKSPKAILVTAKSELDCGNLRMLEHVMQLVLMALDRRLMRLFVGWRKIAASIEIM